MADPRNDGEVQKDPTFDETSEDRILGDAKEGRKTLMDVGKGAVAKHVNSRWTRLEKVARERLAIIKVNWLRYKGFAFAQVHPRDSSRIFVPPGASSKRAPTINKIERTVDRYVAQVTADEPVMEGVPANHSDDARDAAEAVTAVLRSEWQRIGLNNFLRRVVSFSAIMRSGFWFFQWDKYEGEEVIAQKFFETDKGKILQPVDSSGKMVEDPADAARIRQGNIKVSVLSPANVRWEGARYAHDADEVTVSEVMSLRKLYDDMPSTRKVKVSELLDGEFSPTSSSQWLQDFRGESAQGMRRNLTDDMMSSTGERIAETSNVLDEPVLIKHYFKKRSKTYPKGFHAIVAGKHLVHRGNLRYGIIPIAHFKFLDEIADQMGRSLVDLLKDPQELLDFVNGQILRYLQMLKRRWFVPQNSGVKSRDLMSPTRSIIEYNPQAGKPEPEIQPEIPNSMITFVERFDAEYDDQSGIHDTLQGKHVPGVSSGRHAEALRSGDETLLGLTRDQMKIGLEHASKVILSIVKREWKIERRVRYMGENRQYVEQAFSATNFGETDKAVLKNSTLLMLTPAQRLDTVMGMAEAGALTIEEVRQLAPLGDVMGVSLSEDQHYQRARRQSARFLDGPPKDLVRARKEYSTNLEAIAEQQGQIAKMADLGSDPDTVMIANGIIEKDLATTEQNWQLLLDKYAFDHRPWEDRTEIAKIHAQVHADTLAHEKVDSFPEWWVDIFEAHATLEWQMGFPEQAQIVAQLQSAQAVPGEGTPQGFDASQVDSSPAGLNFNDQTPNVVAGGAP